MAWDEVPAKLQQYALEQYAPTGADTTLLNEYGVQNVADVPEDRRADFEADLDYRLGACINLKNSTGKRWTL